MRNEEGEATRDREPFLSVFFERRMSLMGFSLSYMCEKMVVQLSQLWGAEQ